MQMQSEILEETKKSIGSTFQSQKNSIMLWIGFLLSSLVVYWLFSSGDFSFLLTFAAFMRCFGFGLLNFKMWGGKTAKGVSIKTLQLYGLTFTCRLISILRHQGYLPFDKSGDWFYHVIEFGSLFSVCFAIYAILSPLVSTYDEKYDKFGALHIPSEFGAAYLFVPCMILAILFHPSLNREFISDTMWTLSMYLEAVAMIPQIYMFQSAATADGGHVEPLIGHTVFALGFSRIFELFFWVGSFKELSDHSGGRLPGYIVLLSQVCHVLVMADFFYYYFKSLSAGLPMQLPTATFGGMEV